jgi:Kef-type K+ transport system membrane component KefB
MKMFDLSVLFFLQLCIILLACRIVGAAVKYLGQPQVVGEMIAGVLLGPSLFGLLAPDWHAQLFPKESIPILFAVSQVGLSLYMFLVGIEFKVERFRSKAATAISVSAAGMITPFVLGAALALWLHAQGGYFPEKVKWFEAALFLGASLCITAFPMLARIIVENGLAGTTLGTLALAAGALDDVAAWCLLAVVISSIDQSWQAAVFAIGGGALYASIAFAVIGPLVGWLERKFLGNSKAVDALPSSVLVSVLALVMLSSFITDKIGVYAVFGAFILGCAMPRGITAEKIRTQVEPLTVGLLLPLFFTFSGLNTRLDLLTSLSAVAITLLVLLISTVGKGVACWGAARWAGESNSTALAIGALMNARGLMELIMLNIGKEKGIIDAKLFSILVVMAIATTFAASPLFLLIKRNTSNLESLS